AECSLEAVVVAAAALHVAGGVATIEHESVLVHACPSDCSATRVAVARTGNRPVKAWNRHGLEQHQGRGIPAHCRHVRKERGIEHVAYARVPCLQPETCTGADWENRGQ